MRKELNEGFKSELEKLNPAQKKAVDTIEGPVLVIAGPGTGKTQILAARIGHILLQTDAQAHNILCLTYTDAGTIAMRKRLLQFIGPDAYRVHIHTFHSFCNLVIQENLDYFGLRALEPLSELEKIEVLHEIIDEFPSDHPLKRFKGEVYYETGRLDRLFQIMKREGWKTGQVKKSIQAYLEDLPLRDEFIYQRNGKDFKKGDVKEKDIAKQKEKMRELEAAVEAFDVYQQKLKARRRYDFADMILWVLEAFQSDEDLLRNYQERYLYYLVDEFQDTSGAQSELLHLLINYWDQPNVFVVGDDDQSIYAFQDANVKNITAFAKEYAEGLEVVMMTDNYRSTQAILDLSGALIAQNNERLVREMPGLEKKLIASLPYRMQSGVVPEIRTYYNSYHETVHVAQQIAALRERGVPLSEVAVIYRNHRQAEDMARYLQVLDIPLNIKKKLNVLDQPLVRQMLTILEYIQMETERAHSGEHLLFHLLHFPFFGIRPLDIAKLSLDVYKGNWGEKSTSFRREMAKAARKAPSLFDQDADLNPFKRVSSDLEYWLSECHNLTLQELLEKIINRGGILKMALSSPEKVWLMELIHSFFEFVKDECARDTRMQLKQFLEKVKLMQDNHIEVPVYKVSYAAEGVNFLTAHSSKGLEFEYVFLIGADAKTWNSKGRSGTYSLPDTLVSRSEVNEDEEARRLFYVAMTRAREHLFVSWAERSASDKELEKSAFVAEIETAGIAKPSYIALDDEALLEFQMTVLQEVAMPETSLIDQEYLTELLQKYSMSVTHLNNYLRCPLSFYFDNLIRVPRAKSPSMTFGSSVHYALELLFKKMVDSEDKSFPSELDLVSYFEWYMRRNEDSFTPIDFELKLDYGRKILPEYFRHYAESWNKVVTVERAFRNLEVKGVPINGKIDKIEFEGNLANLIDYKTGSYDNAKPKFKRPDPDVPEEKRKPEDEVGGDYWRQAVFYKILMDNERSRDWKMVSAEFDFIEPDKKSGEFFKEKVFITAEDQAIVTDQIVNSYQRIMNHDFTGCGKSDCDWCNFVKNNYRLGNEAGVPSQTEGE